MNHNRKSASYPKQRGRLILAITLLSALLLGTVFAGAGTPRPVTAQGDNPNPPDQVVKLVFIHHSTGENWLTDDYGGLGLALGNNYFVSDTNYGWGPNSIGDRTDILNWPEWFNSPESGMYLDALYNLSEQNSWYTRQLADPGGENQIIMFKSCFPNSDLEGSPGDPPSDDDYLTVGSAKRVYIGLLSYFATRQDKLFVAITAPPLLDPTHSANARAFNNWLLHDWLRDYPHRNVAVFDFYNILTGPDNHHHFYDGTIEHVTMGGDTLYYPTNGDEHPSPAGSQKATSEFVPLLNVYYHRWQGEGPPSQPAPTQAPAVEEPAVEEPVAEEPAQSALPPAGFIYHAVFPGEEIADSKPPPDGIPFEEDGVSLDDLRSYEEHVGKTATWVYFSHNWFRGRSFPLSAVSWIRDAGSIPYIRLMLRSSAEQNVAEPTFTLDRIISGDFDDDLRAWARDARDFGSPLIAEYGTEVNGEWFSWNGIWNGAGTLDGYGDPSEYDGPERFRDAYRHIIQIARDEGASNITWVFHVDGNDIPDEEWNRLEQYYPGDEWIDWLGVSVYGAGDPMDDEWPQLRDGMDKVYPRLAALSPDKPIALLEFGVTSGNPLGNQAEWAEAALTDLVAFRWPRLIGFSWWNEKWENDDDPSHDTNMRVQDNPDLAAVFQRLVGSEPKVLGRVYQPPIPLSPITEEPAVEEPAAEEPSAKASLVDDFEGTYEPDQGWEAWADEQTDTSLTFTLDNEVAHGGSASMRIEFDIAPGSWADFGRSFDSIQDWSDGMGYVSAETPRPARG
jgi:hypothetical protein